MRWLLVAMLCAASAFAWADGFGGDGFVQTTVGTSAPPASCSAGALQFNLACNAINVVMRRE